MAKTQANIYLTIWTDPDFLTLPPNAKLLYFVLLTHPTLNYCGVADWRENRLATMTGGLTIDELRHAAWQLGKRRMLAVDPDTEEVLVRSFVRHDGVLKQPNTTKGMVREYGAIMSLKLRELVTLETRRAVAENPEWKGGVFTEPITKQFPGSSGYAGEMVPDWFEMASGNPTGNTSVDPTPNPSGNPTGIPSRNPSVDPKHTLTSTSTSTSTEVESVSASTEAAPLRNDVEELLDYLDEAITANGSRTPSRNKRNRDAMRLLIDKDGRAPADIRAVIDWAQNDSFWRSNILSASSLRDQYDKLRLQAQRNNDPPSQRSQVDNRVQAWMDLANDQYADPQPPELKVIGQ